MSIKQLLELAGVAHLPKSKLLIEQELINEGFKEAQAEFAQAASEETAAQAITQFRDLVNRNQVQGNERNIDFWRKQGWELFSNFVSTKSQQKSKTQEKRSKVSGNVITLKDDNRWLVIIPLDKEASCFHGKGTSWCTTKPHTDHFEQYYYQKNITLIYCLEKDTGNMWAIAANPKISNLELFDKQDKPLSEQAFLDQTGLNPRDLVMLAHNPVNLEKIETSKQIYQSALTNVNERMESGVTERDPQLERDLMIIKHKDLSAEYIGALYVANHNHPVTVPDALVINATRESVTVLRMVTGLSNSTLRTIVRNDVRALKLIEHPSEQIQMDVIEADPLNYVWIRNPSTKTKQMYLAHIMGGANSYVSDLSKDLQQLLVNADPQFQQMMLDRGSYAIRFVNNPTKATIQTVMNDDRFAHIREKVRNKWLTSAVDVYQQNKESIDTDIASSEKIWNGVDATQLSPGVVDSLTSLAEVYTRLADEMLRMLRKEPASKENKEIIDHLTNFTGTWDRKLAEWSAIVSQQ